MGGCAFPWHTICRTKPDMDYNKANEMFQWALTRWLRSNHYARDALTWLDEEESVSSPSQILTRHIFRRLRYLLRDFLGGVPFPPPLVLVPWIILPLRCRYLIIIGNSADRRSCSWTDWLLLLYTVLVYYFFSSKRWGGFVPNKAGYLSMRRCMWLKLKPLNWKKKGKCTQKDRQNRFYNVDTCQLLL